MIWQTADFDDAAMWDSSNPTRLTPPAGATRVRLTGGVRWGFNVAGFYRSVKIKANNPAGYYALNATFAASQNDPDGSVVVNGSCTLTTGIIEVRDINFFNLTVQQDSGSPMTILGSLGAFPSASWGCFFQMEVLN